MKIIKANDIGTWDKAGRFYIKPEYHTESSTKIRTPSRHWPYSEYKHVFTKKYANQLAAKLDVDQIEVIK